MFLRIAGSKYFAIYFLHFLRIVSIRLRQIFLDLIFDLSFWKIGLFHKFSTLFLHWDNFKYWDYFLYWDYFVYWDYFLDWDYFMYWDYFGRDYFLYWDYFLFWDYLDMGLFWSGLFWAGLLWAGLFWSGLFEKPALSWQLKQRENRTSPLQKIGLRKNSSNSRWIMMIYKCWIV